MIPQNFIEMLRLFRVEGEGDERGGMKYANEMQMNCFFAVCQGSGESDLEDSPEALLDPVGDCVTSYEIPAHPDRDNGCIRMRPDLGSRSRSALPCLSTSSSSAASSTELRRPTPGAADVRPLFTST